MAKRELSSTLKNLKFMQRASNKEEKTKKVEENLPDGNFPSSTAPRRCIVIMEGDPNPGAKKGRMSFQNFNPSIDKLNEVPNSGESEASAMSCDRTSENEVPQDQPQDSKPNNSNTNLKSPFKRKQGEVVSDAHFPNKSNKNEHGQETPSPSSNQKSQKQPKREKLDWNVLRPPKHQSKKQ